MLSAAWHGATAGAEAPIDLDAGDFLTVNGLRAASAGRPWFTISAFDASIAAAGYNSFHETLAFRLPSAYVPNTATRTDDQLARARKFDNINDIADIVRSINALPILNNPLEWKPTDLFLIRLYGYEWNDQAEGILIEMHEFIKAQILDDQLTVVETHKMHNQIWESH